MRHYFLSFQLGISSRGRCHWSSDKDCRKQITTTAHSVNSVSSLALDFGHDLALDFEINYIEGSSAAVLYVYTLQLNLFPAVCLYSVVPCIT